MSVKHGYLVSGVSFCQQVYRKCCKWFFVKFWKLISRTQGAVRFS